MRVAMMTREYPPEVYGGAGVHVTELVAQLKTMCDVDVHCMGALRPGEPDVFVAQPDPKLDGANAALTTLSADLVMVNAAAGATVAHSHTWYAGMAGHLASMLYGIPHVLTAHSLEPMRPWKAEQLGGGYRVSSWVERTAVEAADAVIAVSSGMRDDVLAAYPALNPDRVHVVRNGVDTEKWYPVEPGPTLERIGVDPTRPIVAFVGRITRQKGVAHLVAAAHEFAPDVQLVLCAGAPDTPEIAAEVGGAVERLASSRSGIFWVQEMLPGDQIREILSAATVFVCPSVYEPLGIVNLEAMACSTAVVASDVGGIPEVVNDGETGVLVHYDPADATGFEARLANAVNALVADPDRAGNYGRAGRQRCIDEFSWARIAEQTLEIYQKVSG
ncbi:glycogen synthase [Mycolicibacterium hodleri]|uniref:Glycogen synthase n=1 Tax=Mycolicibacterium hodleri TaxID=49897 RepID=A0A502EHN8_9MYCO|nr:glycogen synthase [Mycolicibacterium hodleri]TPG36016.1 glycogen synthase [Mycolicibacterium hodleri]